MVAATDLGGMEADMATAHLVGLVGTVLGGAVSMDVKSDYSSLNFNIHQLTAIICLYVLLNFKSINIY